MKGMSNDDVRARFEYRCSGMRTQKRAAGSTTLIDFEEARHNI